MSLYATGQSISGVTFSPANPTSGDSVKAYISLVFSSGGCDPINITTSRNGNQIDAYVYHCPGPLTFICNVTDTVNLGLLPPDNYQLTTHVMVDNGGLGSNCTNFIEATTSIDPFTVNNATNIPTPGTAGAISLKYRADNGHFLLTGLTGKAQVRMMDLTGRTLFNGTVSAGEIVTRTPPVPGLLIYTITTPDGRSKTGRLLVQ